MLHVGAPNEDSCMLNACNMSIIHRGMLLGSVAEEQPCDAALVFPLFLIQDVSLLTAREAAEQQTDSRSRELCPTLLG